MRTLRGFYPLAALLLALSLLFLFSACSGPAQEVMVTAVPPEITGTVTPLTFETLDRDDYMWTTGRDWPVRAPGIAIIANPVDIEPLDDYIALHSQALLVNLDFDLYFALAAFLPTVPPHCAESEWGIQQVLLREDELLLYAIYPEERDRNCEIGPSSPYHLISLPDEVLSTATRFTLYLNQEFVVTATYPPVVTQATPLPTPSPAGPTITPGPTYTPWPTGTPPVTPVPAAPYPPPSSAEQTVVAALATAALEGYPVPPTPVVEVPLTPVPTLLAVSRVTAIRWSADSQLLYYRRGDQTLVHVIGERGGLSHYAEPPPTATLTPLLPNLPALTDYGIAPSGERLLYVVRLSSTATPLPPASPEAMGEIWLGGGPGQLWLADSNGQQLVGELENCVSDFFWSEDETRVVVAAVPPPAPCEESWAWFVDLQKKTITNLFLRRQYTELRGFALSPSGQQLLFHDQPGLHLLDLDHDTTRILELPGAAGGAWLSESRLLVRYRPDVDWLVGIYNLESNELAPLIDPAQLAQQLGSETTPQLERIVIRDALVSPDRRWLAFTADEDYYQMGFWVLALPEAAP